MLIFIRPNHIMLESVRSSVGLSICGPSFKMVQFTLSKDQSEQITGAAMPAVLHTADFLVLFMYISLYLTTIVCYWYHLLF